MENNEKQEGGICPDCGGTYIKNPKTGKIFCENKCWLNHGRPYREDTGSSSLNNEDEKWRKIHARKEEGMNWLNAKRGSAELVSALIIAKMLPMPTEDALRHYARFFYEMEPPVSEETPDNDEQTPNDGEQPIDEEEDVIINDIPF